MCAKQYRRAKQDARERIKNISKYRMLHLRKRIREHGGSNTYQTTLFSLTLDNAVYSLVVGSHPKYLAQALR